MEQYQEIIDYVKQNQMRKVLFGGYSKEDVQIKMDMILAMLEKYEKEHKEKETAMLADFEQQLEAVKKEFENKKRITDILIIDLNKNISELTTQNQTMEQEQFKMREAYDALTAENETIVQEQYKMKEAYKAYCGEILKKYSESLDVLSGEFNKMLENVSVMQKSISEDSIFEGFERALEMMGEN